MSKLNHPSSGTQESFSSLAIHTPRPRRKSLLALSGFQPLLDNFLIGQENTPIREISAANSISNLHRRSPILLYGPTGVGKTAIALTLATRWINDKPNRTYNLIHALDFARSLVLAIESDDMPRFREQFREANCLLIDNVHELAGKEAAQGELVEILNTLNERETLIMFTSAALPSLLSHWNPALGSRMVAGHSIEVQHPAPSTRFELLRTLARTQGLQIEEADLRKLNDQFTENLSLVQLKGMLTRWQHHQRTLQELNAGNDPTNIQSRIDAIVEAQEANTKSPLEIAKMVAKELRQTLESMRGPSRKASVVRARGLAMFLIRKETDSSFQSIGEIFGNRDHTTVMHACKKTEDDLAQDTELARCVERLRRRFL